MNENSFSIRRMNRNELDIAMDWATFEGWNPGKHDAECFYEADPNGFFMGLLDGEPVAMVSAVPYGETYGFMGFYIVKPQYRNTGFGMKMWDSGMKYLGARTIGLDSVRPDLVSLQKPEFTPSWLNFRFKWIKNRQFRRDSSIVNLVETPLGQLAEYDQTVFGFAREDFLKSWINRPGTTALGMMLNGEFAGYGVIRECREGYKIGPLFAENKTVAKSIFDALTRDVQTGAPIFLDAPQVNTEAVSIADELDMLEVFRTTRMYNGLAPNLPLEKWFGLTSFELG